MTVYHTARGDFAANGNGCILIPAHYSILQGEYQKFVLARVTFETVTEGNKERIIPKFERNDAQHIGDLDRGHIIAPVPKIVGRHVIDGYMDDYRPAESDEVQGIYRCSYRGFQNARKKLARKIKKINNEIETAQKEAEAQIQELREGIRALQQQSMPSLTDILNGSS